MAAKEKRELTIRTVYYNRRDVVKTIASGREINAVKNCVGWMKVNRYEATHAEVYDTATGKLYGVVVNKLRGGKLHTIIEYEGNPDSKAAKAKDLEALL